ncbi:GNAT family N-acetyltransferase [uncultured Sphingomonas sp.]|uniref:GNAT family N-acetyltransferase n=1 Tax=uncultured Sphingomonas sp. TaxID=158754 RepID=UPI0025D8BDC6|nr:GNAT family N-acetyltransferase [uncultured Sphingomonas sp.]
MALPDEQLTLKQIEAGDKLSGLSLGHADFTPLKAFIQTKAMAFERQSLSRTYGIFGAETKNLRAYMTLVCGEVAIGEEDPVPIDNEGVDFNYKHFPAVKIARLAVDRRLQGLGVGQKLVNVALGVAKGTICPVVGCRFMMVDSKRQSVGFYEKCGFTVLDTVGNRGRDAPVMFIDLSKIPA